MASGRLRVLAEVNSLGMFLFFARVELGNRPVIAHYSGPDFTGLAFTIFEFSGVVHGSGGLGVCG